MTVCVNFRHPCEIEVQTFGGLRPLSTRQPARYTPATLGPQYERTADPRRVKKHAARHRAKPIRQAATVGFVTAGKSSGVMKRVGPARRCRQAWAGKPRAQEERA
jgi:hypothetical protein